MRFQETPRRLAMTGEGFGEHPAGPGLDPAQASALDPKTAALLRAGVCAAMGSPAGCLPWSTGRAPAAGAGEDEIAGVLPATAPVAGLSRVACGAPDLAAALGSHCGRAGGTR